MPTAVEFAVELALTINNIENGQLVDRSEVQGLLQLAASFEGTDSAGYQDIHHIPTLEAKGAFHNWESARWETKQVLPALQAALDALQRPSSVAVVDTVGHPQTPDAIAAMAAHHTV